MKLIRQFINSLRPVDILIIFFLLFLSVVHIFVATSAVEWIIVFCINLIVTAGIGILARMAQSPHSNIIRIIYDFYPVPMILLAFKEVHVVIQSMARTDIDSVFIEIDRMMFGTDPTVWTMQFTTPVLTEVLQLAYVSYYLLMLALGIELYLKKEHKQFSVAIFAILYGFFLSYIGYILFPAVGPRFTLHNFSTLNAELPGLWFSNAIRDFINAGESIPKGAENALALAQRDAFPSGHTQMTLIVMFYAARFSIKSRYIIYVLGTLLIISTVYLRYHYVIDVIGGVVFMIVTVWSTPKLMNALTKEKLIR